jgi:hypothetical protein
LGGIISIDFFQLFVVLYRIQLQLLNPQILLWLLLVEQLFRDKMKSNVVVVVVRDDAVGIYVIHLNQIIFISRLNNQTHIQ